jgi:hypothetical protein
MSTFEFFARKQSWNFFVNSARLLGSTVIQISRKFRGTCQDLRISILSMWMVVQVSLLLIAESPVMLSL